MACRPQSGSKATAFGAKSNDQQSDDVRFERPAGWLADTAAAAQIPDVFAAVPKGVSLVPLCDLSTCNDVCAQVALSRSPHRPVAKGRAGWSLPKPVRSLD